jgi:hypothetical protein
MEQEAVRLRPYPVMALLFLLAAACALAQPVPTDQEARRIILRSVERDQSDLEIRRDYTFISRTEQRNLDSSGRITKTETETHEVMILYGRPYRRLIAKDDKPLAAGAELKERGKMDKEVARRRKESEKDKEKQAREESRSIRQEREVLREIADAFDFQLLGDDSVDGYPTWVIQMEPTPGYEPRSRDTKILSRLHGKLWVTKDDYRWVKVEAEVIRSISVGLVLARLNPGTQLDFEQKRVQGEVWMPNRVRARVNARLAFLKKINAEVDVTYSDYRKFQADSRVTETMEVTPPLP